MDDDLTLSGFDLLILHLDVDVAGFDYDQLGREVVRLGQVQGWGELPCAQLCPPVNDTISRLLLVMRSWLGQVGLGRRTVSCLPAQSSGTWLAAACLEADHELLEHAECDPQVEGRLNRLPKGQRVKKK